VAWNVCNVTYILWFTLKDTFSLSNVIKLVDWWICLHGFLDGKWYLFLTKTKFSFQENQSAIAKRVNFFTSLLVYYTTVPGSFLLYVLFCCLLHFSSSAVEFDAADVLLTHNSHSMLFWPSSFNTFGKPHQFLFITLAAFFYLCFNLS